MRRRYDRVVVAVLLAALMPVGSVCAEGEDEIPFLSHSVDDYKTSFVSGNLTAAVTHDWPRVAFYHTNDRFSPTFEIGMPIIYLFNDTNRDGIFARSEATYLAYLDSLRNAPWNISLVLMGADPEAGQFALLNRSADIALYDIREPMEPVMERWAKAHFSFRITENPVTHHNLLGDYRVEGMIDMHVRMTLEILHKVNSTGLVLEQSLKGGLTTNTFVLTEDLGLDQLASTKALSRVDETVNGDDFTHRFNLTDLPVQCIDIAKEDGTVQAHYRTSSVPMMSDGANITAPPMNCSYYTFGSGMILHTAFMVPDANGTITNDMCLGIDESGFYEHVGDWLAKNLAAVLMATAIVAAVSLITLMVIRRKKRDRDREGPAEPVQVTGPRPPGD
jgi:hypothetical protein